MSKLYKCSECLEEFLKEDMSKTGCYRGWCKTCAEIDQHIGNWADACWSESLKPENEQNMNVYRGYY
jgi:hypothetical protein